MKEQLLDDEGLNTLMCEVEAIVNGRPLTKLSDDPRDLEPLTPNHLLLLRRFHQESSRRRIATKANDGVKYSTSQACFGEDGSENIYHRCKNDRSGPRGKETWLLVILFRSWTKKHHVVLGHWDVFKRCTPIARMAWCVL